MAPVPPVSTPPPQAASSSAAAPDAQERRGRCIEGCHGCGLSWRSFYARRRGVSSASTPAPCRNRKHRNARGTCSGGRRRRAPRPVRSGVRAAAPALRSGAANARAAAAAPAPPRRRSGRRRRSPARRVAARGPVRLATAPARWSPTLAPIHCTMRWASPRGTKLSLTSATVSRSTSCVARFRRSNSSSSARGCTSRVTSCASDSKLGARAGARQHARRAGARAVSRRCAPMREHHRRRRTRRGGRLAWRAAARCCSSRRLTSRRFSPVAALTRLARRCSGRPGCAACAVATTALRSNSSSTAERHDRAPPPTVPTARADAPARPCRAALGRSSCRRARSYGRC